jgi:hypothetical protein
MSIADRLRRVLFASGLTSVMMSILLDGQFATDAGTVPVSVPEPGSLGLLAAAGLAGIVVSLIRRRKK